MIWWYLITLGLTFPIENLVKLDLKTSLCNGFDIRDLTTASVHHLFKVKAITVSKLIQCYLKRINRLNPLLKAIIQTNPSAIQVAYQLDHWLNTTHQLKGPLHGIPILINDKFAIRGKMNTTAGSWALLSAKPKQTAKVVRKLQKAGAIILGKTNMAFARVTPSDPKPCFCTGGGSSTYPYPLKARPPSSSLGSEVAITANLAMVALGTSAEGFYSHPSAATSLVGSKPSADLISNEGVIPLAPSLDSVGVLTRTLHDNLLVTALISDTMSMFGLDGSYSFKPVELKDLRVGLLQFQVGRGFYQDVQMSGIEQILKRLVHLGLNVTYIPQADRLTGFETGKARFITKIQLGYGYLVDFLEHVNQYLMANPFPNPIRSLESVKTNLNNSNHPEGFKKYWFKPSQSVGGMDLKYLELISEAQESAKDLIEEFLEVHQVDVLLTLLDPTLTSHIPFFLAGYPTLNLPLGVMPDGSPFGAAIYSRWGFDHEVYSIAQFLDAEAYVPTPPLIYP